jgi:hypothetical protein
MAAADLVALFPARTVVTAARLAQAAETWSAFREPSPERLQGLVERGLAPLRRLLQEYPWTTHGLSRSEAALLACTRVNSDRGQVFSAYCLTEDPRYYGPQASPAGLKPFGGSSRPHSGDGVFLGDSAAFWRLETLSSGRLPALNRTGPTGYRITGYGEKLLDGRADWVLDNGIDRWIGGVHLTGHSVAWRWDPVTSRLSAS